MTIKGDYKKIEGYTLKFRYTVSRGTDTYGYTICSCYFNNQKVTSCSGGGYDLAGTSFGEWIEKTFPEELKKKSSKGLYGFSFWNAKTKKSQSRWSKACFISLDGACGFDCMKNILNHLGYTLRYISESKKETVYLIEIFNAKKAYRRHKNY